MADSRQLAGLGGRAGAALSGATAPQEILGLLQLIKARMMAGKPLNTSLGPQGEVMYEDPGLDTPAAAMGSFVSTTPGGGDPDVLKHEMRHVAQSDALGPLYLPAAISEQFASYGGGPMERDAIRHATPQSELLRKGSSMYTPAQKPAAHAFLRALLGE